MDSIKAQLQTKIDTLNTKNNILERENESVKKTIVLKNKEIRSDHERIRSSDDHEKKLEK